MSSTTSHSLRSSHREALLEHLFAGEIMKRLWLAGIEQLEVLKPQVDDGGYDLVLEANSIVRHIQLKCSFLGSTVRQVNLNAFLAGKPSGCVVFIRFDQQTLELGPFAYFGGPPGHPLPSITHLRIAKHSKGNAAGVKTERPNIRVLPLSEFVAGLTWEQLLEKLFVVSEPKASTSARSRRSDGLGKGK